MHRILTGKVDSGKTSRMMEIAETYEKPGGFICIKCYKENNVTGYDLHFLSSGKIIPFIRTSELADPLEPVALRQGAFLFYQRALEKGIESLEQATKQNLSPIFIDELGPVELRKEGFYQPVMELLTKQIPLVLAIRRSLLKEMTKLLGLESYDLIEVAIE